MKKILEIIDKPISSNGNVFSLCDVKTFKDKPDQWTYSLEFKGILKEGKIYKVTVEEINS